MPANIRHIVFDIGKVLIHYDPNIPYSRIIPDEKERAWFFENVCTNEWNLEQDRGRTWADAEALLLETHPDHEKTIRAFRQHWHEMVSHPYDDSVAILKSLLASGHDVTMLTNFASDTFREAQKMYPFLTLSRGVTVSGDVRLIKPDVAIYDLHARTFGLDPASSLFIDDSLPNVEGAKAAGWQAVHFTGAEQLKADLVKFGLEA
jgi:2-haloacid dehalogenase